MRQREYELELRRERELQREREKERGREREREKERDKDKERDKEKEREYERHSKLYKSEDNGEFILISNNLLCIYIYRLSGCHDIAILQ